MWECAFAFSCRKKSFFSLSDPQESITCPLLAEILFPPSLFLLPLFFPFLWSDIWRIPVSDSDALAAAVVVAAAASAAAAAQVKGGAQKFFFTALERSLLYVCGGGKKQAGREREEKLAFTAQWPQKTRLRR